MKSPVNPRTSASDLMVNIRKGDKISFTQLYSKIAPAFKMFCCGIVCESDVGERIFERAFSELWPIRLHLTSLYTVKGQLYERCGKICMYFKQLMEERAVSVTEVDSLPWPDDYALSPEQRVAVDIRVVHTETINNLREGLERISPLLRKIVQLTWKGETDQEIARRLKIPEAMVKTLLAEALAAMNDAGQADRAPLVSFLKGRRNPYQ
ncbi:hypothetical protein MKQ70_32235 [Chitinophaga sedimenti]|uniref:RNA polymerase sigma factor n=1 Tax=Chitinophaga sedimenti TaxID=2033606 RepID=UPI002003DD07|nr:sigma factor-like helix-turn-helix DNA-binding protein [Chitinophaga sedimenti]MCK7559387.1 hypothetical protein [Chitinophaga sedimenti]